MRHNFKSAECQVLKQINGSQVGDLEAKDYFNSISYQKIFELTRKLRKKNKNHSIIDQFTTSDMVHETWCKVASAESKTPIETKKQFYDYIHQTMHSILIDSKKRMSTLKRNANVVSISDAKYNEHSEIKEEYINEKISLSSEIYKLLNSKPKHAQILIYYYYLGLKVKEIAIILHEDEKWVEVEKRKLVRYLKEKLNSPKL